MTADLLDGDMRTIVRTGVHPFVLKAMGSSVEALAHSPSDYHPSMAPHLPASTDSRGILHFFGLDNVAVERTLQAFAASTPQPPSGRAQDAVTKRWRFPLSDALLEAYLRSTPRTQETVPPTYEGYYSCALKMGLRPEYACTVGLHPSDPRFTSAPDPQEFHDEVDPQAASRDYVTDNKYILDALWCDRMRQEAGQPAHRDTRAPDGEWQT